MPYLPQAKERWSQWNTEIKKDMERFESSVDGEVREALSRMIRDAGITAQGELVHERFGCYLHSRGEREYDLVVMGRGTLLY